MKGKWFKQILASVLSAALCCTALAGCGDKQGDNGASKPSSEETGSLSVTFLGLDGYYRKKDGNMSNYYLDGFKAIKDAHPGLKLDYNFASQMEYTCRMDALYHANGEDVQALNDYKAYVEKMMMRSELDLVEGNSRNVDFPDADIIDWNKMMQSGHFASLDALNTDGDEWEQIPLSDNFYYNGELCAVPLWCNDAMPYFASTEEKLAEWDFQFPTDADGNPDHSPDILTCLRCLADWATAHQNDPGAPYVMPDYIFNQLYVLTFDLIDRNMVDYANRTVRFDTPEVRQAVEYLKIIRSRVYQADLKGTTSYEDSLKGFAEGRYLFCCGLSGNEGTSMRMRPRVLNGQYYYFAVKWLLIPEASRNQQTAYEMIQQIQTIDTNDFYGYSIPEMQSHGEQNWKWCQENFVVVIPNTWVLQLNDLFTSYFNGNVSLDDLCTKVQSRLEIYISE